MTVRDAIRRLNGDPVSWLVLAVVVVPMAWFFVVVALSISI